MTTTKKIKAVQYFIFGFLAVFLFSLALVPNTYASQFPSDSQTVGLRNETASDNLNVLFLDNVDSHIRTIHAIASQQLGSKEVTIYCGSNAGGTAVAIFDAMGSTNTSFQRFMQAKCSLPLYVDSYRQSFVGMTYTDRDVATTLDPLAVVTVTSLATSTMATVTNGFTYGESLQILLLIMLFTLLLFSTVKNWLFGTKVQNTKRDVIIKKDI